MEREAVSTILTGRGYIQSRPQARQNDQVWWQVLIFDCFSETKLPKKLTFSFIDAQHLKIEII